MNSCNRISRQAMQAICLLATLLRFSACPTEAAETSAVLSSAMREALPGLSAEDYQTREQAQKQIQLALGQQLASLLGNHDIEAEARTAALLEFNDGVTRWAIDALQLPPEQRQAQIKWGLNPEVLPIVARIYSPTLNNRIEGIKQLPKYDDADVSFLLARLLSDSDRAVYLGAMEAVWDRKPTDAIVDALWYRAVENGFALPNSQPVGRGGNMVFFRGRPIGDNIAASRRLQDDKIAVEVLINLKAPQMRDRLKTFFEKAEVLIFCSVHWRFRGRLGIDKYEYWSNVTALPRRGLPQTTCDPSPAAAAAGCSQFSSAPHTIPKLTRGDDSRSLVVSEYQQVLIAGDKVGRLVCFREAKKVQIVWIAAGICWHAYGRHAVSIVHQQLAEFRDNGRRYFQFGEQLVANVLNQRI